MPGSSARPSGAVGLGGRVSTGCAALPLHPWQMQDAPSGLGSVVWGGVGGIACGRLRRLCGTRLFVVVGGEVGVVGGEGWDGLLEHGREGWDGEAVVEADEVAWVAGAAGVREHAFDIEPAAAAVRGEAVEVEAAPAVVVESGDDQASVAGAESVGDGGGWVVVEDESEIGEAGVGEEAEVESDGVGEVVACSLVGGPDGSFDAAGERGEHGGLLVGLSRVWLWWVVMLSDRASGLRRGWAGRTRGSGGGRG